MLFVVAVNGLLIYLALSTWTGIETEGAYQKGIAYNDVLSGAKRQAELGWTVKAAIKTTQAPDTPQTIRAAYHDRTGAPITGLTVRAYLKRPVHEGFDQELMLTPTDGGRYQGHVRIPLPGQWELRLVARDTGGNVHQSVTRISVP